MTKKSSKKAFTLVELIIVIAIIAILAVTAFLLLTKRLAKARDASRSSNLANIENSLQISLTENSSLPKPDSYVLIYASGTTNIIGYQGYFGEGVKDSVGNINSAPKDGDDYFTYYLNADLNKYQLASFMENEIAYNPNVVSAVDYASRYVNVRGNKLGLLTDSNKSPLQSLGMTGLDLLTGTASYVAYFDNSDNVAGTGKQLFTYYYNKTKSLLNNKEFAKNDDSLVFYSDMETLTGTLLADLSQYGNNGNCYNSGTLVNCGDTGGPQIVQGENGKAMQFNGSGSYINITSGSSILNRTGGVFTFNAKVKPYALSPWGGAILRIGIGCYTPGFSLDLGATGKFGFYDSDGIQGGVRISCGSSKIGLNTRYNLFLISDGKYIKAIIDGIVISTANYSRIYSPLSTMSLDIGGNKGVCSTYGAFFNGLIDEVRIYNRALSNDEVKALYDAN